MPSDDDVPWDDWTWQRWDDGAPPAPRSDAEIYAIAGEIRRAVRVPLAERWPYDILAARNELPRDEEDRVIAAVSVLQLLDEVRL